MNTIDVSLVVVVVVMVVFLVVAVTFVQVMVEEDFSFNRIPVISPGEMSSYQQTLIHSGADPFLVIALCRTLLQWLPSNIREVNPAIHHIYLCSAYSSQVRFLVAGNQYRFAMVFLLWHFWHAVAALVYAKRKFSFDELEKLSAGLFMVSVNVPGMRMLLGWAPLKVLSVSLGRVGEETSHTAVAVTLSKCYALTRRMKYLELIKTLSLDRESNREDMLRVAENLGMDIDRLYIILAC